MGKAIYQELQRLKSFVDFVAEQPETDSISKQSAEEVKWLIENIDQPETHPSEWMVCIDIRLDGMKYEPQKEKDLLTWKRWWLTFEQGRLELEILDDYLQPDRYTYEKSHFYQWVGCEDGSQIEGQNPYGDQDIQVFLKDAFDFRKYMTGDLKEVETEIWVSEFQHTPEPEQPESDLLSRW